MSKATDVSVLRGMMDGQPVTLESVTLWDTWTDVVTKEKKRKFIGYKNEYIQNGAIIPGTLFPSLMRRRLVVPAVTEEGQQTFEITQSGIMVAMYEQVAFELDLPTVAEYA